jgi:hypothetical protein
MPEGKPSEYFGLMIAFLVPGFLAVWAISSLDPVAGGWIGTASQQQTTIGGFLFVVLASLGIGVFISGIRSVLEGMILNPGPNIDERNRREHESVYKDLRDQHYRFYQFHGNTAISLALAYMILLGRDRVNAAVTIAWLLAEIVLLFNAAKQIRAYRAKCLKLLGTYSPPKAP